MLRALRFAARFGFEIEEDLDLLKEELAFDWLNKTLKGNIKELNYSNEV